MNQYGDNDLVNNSRYQGQSGGTDGRGSEGESRYGAMPVGTGTGNSQPDPLETIRNPAAYGFKKDEPQGFRYPGMSGVGSQQQNLVEPNAHPSQAGYGSSQLGYGQHQDFPPNSQSHNPLRDDFAKDQPGYGQPGFGAASLGQNTSNLWPSPAAPPNAHRSDLVGQGYGAPREGMLDKAKDAVGMGPNSGAQGYDNYGNPRREGVVDKAKDAVGIGPNSGYDNRRDQSGYDNYGNPRQEGVVDKMKDAVGMGPNSGAQGYDNRRDQPGYGTQGYGQPREGMVDKAKDAVGMGPNSGYDNRRDEPGYGTQGYGQPREGILDKAKDAVGMGPNSGYDNRRDQPGYDNYGNPQREGVVDKVKDAAGMGPNTGRPYDASHNPNVNHPSEERGFGGGLGQPHGTNTGYDQSQNLGSGYDNRMATGADAYGQPRREGLADKMKDAVGVGPNSGYDDRTRTGVDAYVHGNHPAGMQDRITGVNEPTMLEGRHGVQGVGHRDGVLGIGEHVPENILGERRTEPGYDMSKGHLSDHLGHHNSPHGTGLGHHDASDYPRRDVSDTDYDERRGKGFEDTTGVYGTNTGTETGYDDTDVHHGTGTAPPKKGIITKIKEKLHH